MTVDRGASCWTWRRPQRTPSTRSAPSGVYIPCSPVHPAHAQRVRLPRGARSGQPKDEKDLSSKSWGVIRKKRRHVEACRRAAKTGPQENEAAASRCPIAQKIGGSATSGPARLDRHERRRSRSSSRVRRPHNPQDVTAILKKQSSISRRSSCGRRLQLRLAAIRCPNVVRR